VSVYAPTVITVARVESELDYWFSAEPPACSVLWLMGDPQDDLVPALVRIGAGLAPLRCGIASCVPWSRLRTLAGLAGAELLLEATTSFAGAALANSSSPIVRHETSRGSGCEVVGVDAQTEGVWQVLSSRPGLRLCAALFPRMTTVPDSWVYSAVRLVMVGGTNVLSRGVGGALDGLLHAFLTDTLQAGGIAVISGGLELCGPGVALTGSGDQINQVERALGETWPADETLVRRSLELAGPWTGPARRQYERSPATGRWVAARLVDRMEF
jgi:hypothetical protein